MQRITHSTVADTLPPISSTGDPGFFREGLPGTSEPSTYVAADWCNGIQEELAYIIEEAGLTLDIDDNTLLYQAIQAMIAAYVATLNFVPVGTIIFRGASSAPSGWLFCNGAAVSRTTYAGLFAAIGETFGSGDGTTTFNLPDLRAKFVRGWAASNPTYDAGRVFGSTQDEDYLGHAHTITLTSAGGHTPAGTISGDGSHTHTVAIAANGAHTHTGTASQGGAHGHSFIWDNNTQYVLGGGNNAARFIGNSSDSNDTHNTVNLTGGQHSHSLAIDDAAAHIHTATLSGPGTHAHSFSGTAVAAHTHTATAASSGGTETRPRNIALYPLIKT